MDLDQQDVPRMFVDWRVLEKILEQATTGGVHTAILMRFDGSLLCVSGALSTGRLLSALIAPIYQSYMECIDQSINPSINQSINQSNDQSINQSDELTLTLHVQNSQVIMSSIDCFIVCLQADQSAHEGQLAHKLQVLKKSLEPMKMIYS